MSAGCEVCGTFPYLSQTGLCGPCTFGTADAIGEGDVFEPEAPLPAASRERRTQAVPVGMLGCTVCNRNFRTGEALDAHRGAVHGDVRAFRCTAGGCRRGFVTSRGLADHRRVKHSSVAAQAAGGAA